MKAKARIMYAGSKLDGLKKDMIVDVLLHLYSSGATELFSGHEWAVSLRRPPDELRQPPRAEHR